MYIFYKIYLQWIYWTLFFYLTLFYDFRQWSLQSENMTHFQRMLIGFRLGPEDRSATYKPCPDDMSSGCISGIEGINQEMRVLTKFQGDLLDPNRIKWGYQTNGPIYEQLYLN
jgi:hypothetical protein